MDSVTQMTLGAAVGEAVLGRKVGAKAAIWGAALGTLPDLDVLVPFADAVRDFTYHRSFSHSIFVLTLLSPLIVWLIGKLHPDSKADKSGWAWLVWLCFMTHLFIDCLTIYGTQIFWPFWDYPVGVGSVFIIDPFYTVPLMIGIIAALVMARNTGRGHLINLATLNLSTIYLLWSIAAQSYVTTAVEESLARQSVNYEKLLVSAGPLNTFLWRIVAVEENGDYVEGFYSLLDGQKQVTLSHHQSNNDLLSSFSDHWPVERLRWFTKGFYKVWQKGDEVVITDLRMGTEPNYVFSFIVGKTAPEGGTVKPRQLVSKQDFSILKKTWRRIWSASQT